MHQSKLNLARDHVASLVGNAGQTPGAVVLVARHGKIVMHEAFGKANWGNTPNPPKLTVHSIFDLLSMTKPLAGALTMALWQDGVLGASDKLSKYIVDANASITLDNLLTHSSGLVLDINIMLPNPLTVMAIGSNDVSVWSEQNMNKRVEYSDLGYRLLGAALDRAGGAPLETLMQHYILNPLGMSSTFYNPAANPALSYYDSHDRQAGTGWSETRQHDMIGEVSDDQDLYFGGVAACDGLFSTAHDYAVFAQTLLNMGSYGSCQLLKSGFVSRLTENATPFASSSMVLTNRWESLVRGPKSRGFERPVTPTNPMSSNMPYSGSKLSNQAYVKAGGAGTFVVIDPTYDIIMIYLTNHGLPSFDGFGEVDGHPVWAEWDAMLNALRPDGFFDLVMDSIDD